MSKLNICKWLRTNVFAFYDVKLDRKVNELLGKYHNADFSVNNLCKTLILTWTDENDPVRIRIEEYEKKEFVNDGHIIIEMENVSGKTLFKYTKWYTKPIKYHWGWGTKIQKSTIEKIIILYDDYISSQNFLE